ncbi:MAG TPA: hypothetical protein VNV66_10200 [Pilimelia sp.]|nr:hypothetical protein [Pilimelia sp.]
MTNDSGTTAAPAVTDAGDAAGDAADRPRVARQARRGPAGQGPTTASATTRAAAADRAVRSSADERTPGSAVAPGGTRASATTSPEPAAPEAGPLAPPVGGRPVDQESPGGAAAPPADLPPAGVGVLAALSLAWLAVMLRGVQVIVESAGAFGVASAAYALPGVVSASLVAGAAVGLLAVRTLTRRLTPRLPLRDSAGLRFAFGLAAGAATGLLAAAPTLTGPGAGMPTMVLAGTIAAAGTVGGAAAGLRAAHVVAPATAAALAVFLVGFVLNLFQQPLFGLYGYGQSAESKASAYGWFALTTSLCGGLAAGLVAFAYRRRTWRPSTPPVPVRAALGYLAAGAGPGLLLLVAELITRAGGARVLALTSAISDADRSGQVQLDASRVKYALALLFLGGITAMVAYGRTLGGRNQPPATTASSSETSYHSSS